MKGGEAGARVTEGRVVDRIGRGIAGLAMLAAVSAGGVPAAARAQSPQGATAGPGPGAAAALSPAQRQEVPGILREALRADPSILGDVLRQNPSLVGEVLGQNPSLVGDVLRENPAILRDAFAALQRAETRDREEAARAAIARHAEALFRDPADPMRGNPNGAVTVVEFFDARCGYCKQLHPVMEQLVRRNRDVRVVLKDLPVLGPTSVLASRALLAAQRQGKHEPLHDALMRLREEPTEPVLRREAERAGLDWARLRRDMDDPAIARRLEQTMRLAGALRVEGTPALVVGETLIPGAVDLATLERMVAEARERAAAAAASPRR
jgi:protein-disulfide isomerase